MDDEKAQRAISEIADEIAGLGTTFDDVASALRRISGELTEEMFANGADYYRAYMMVTAHLAALEKCHILTQNNVRFLETFNVLTVTRYVFELLVWLRILEKDSDQAIELFVQVGEQQAEHIEAYTKKLTDEIALFREFDKEDKIPQSLVDDLKAGKIRGDEVGQRMREHEAEIDRRARRRFCLYARAARVNGYGFQAHLIEEKAIPRAVQHLADVRAEQAAFESTIGQAEFDRITKTTKGKRARSSWKDRAQSVGMGDQYEFIYGYTSKLLHALPFSFYTRQKNLEALEMEVFLDFAYVSMLDIIDLGTRVVCLYDTRRTGSVLH